jgi:hypothetical protein
LFLVIGQSNGPLQGEKKKKPSDICALG